MNRHSTWPELDRLARLVRAADSLTDALGIWTGRGVGIDSVRRLDQAFPTANVAEHLALHDGARVQDRHLLALCQGVVVAECRWWVAVDSAALTPAVRLGLRAGGDLETLLRPLGARRVVVRVAPQRATPADDPEACVLAVQARIDVAGTPVAWCEEAVLESVFAGDAPRGVPGRARLTSVVA